MNKILLFAAAFLVIIFQLNGQNIIVPTDYNNIQQAIDSSSNGDTIEVLPGTYTGTGNIEIDFNGKSITLKSTKGADSTIIDCQTLGRAFYFHSNETENATINGFTIKNGKHGEYGGGIYCAWSSPTITNCIIANCEAERGGGLSFSNSSAIVSNCRIINNYGDWGGGLFCYYSSPIINNTEFESNKADCFAALNISHYSHPFFGDCTFENNDSRGTCGGIINIYFNCNPHFLRCKIVNNNGKGINITNYSNVKITNCLIADNTLDGLWCSNFNHTVTIENTNIVNNGRCGIYSGSTTFNITNSIIYGNTSEEIYLWSGNPPNISYSIVEGKDGDEIFGNINWTGVNYDQDPGFVNPSVHNYELKRNSICIENGNPLEEFNSEETDLAGKPRIMGKHIDIGTYEYCQYFVEDTYFICSGDSIFLGNSWQKTSGYYSDTIVDAYGCDVITTTNLIVLNKSNSTIEEEVCNSYTSPSGRYTWTTSETYQDTILNSIGCDSIITINLTVNNKTYSTITETVCDSFTSPSGNYIWTSSGTYEDIIPNTNGCDSIITINLIVIKSTSSSITENVCDSYTSPSENYTWTSSGIYEDIIPNAIGCDSIITIYLTVKNTYAIINETVCNSYIPPSGNFVWTSSGTYEDIILNSNGCDSIITVNLTVNKKSHSTITETVCDSYISPSGNYIWTNSGTYEDIISNTNGCDSIITINLIVIKSTSSSITETVCDSYTSPSGNYTWTSSGIYEDIISNTNGCEGTITINLTVNKKSYSSITETVYDSYISPSGNYTWTSSGTYEDIIPNSNGCDSIITINLTVNKKSYSTITETVCDSYISPSGNYTWTISGMYEDIISNTNGGDSIITIDLTVVDINTEVDLTEGLLIAMEDSALYQWVVCTTGNIINDATDKSYKPVVSGLYSVKISKAGCEATSSCYGFILSDIVEIKGGNLPIAYPNPVFENLTIELKKYYNEIEVEIIDIGGKKISRLDYQNLNKIDLKTSYLKEGLYVIKLKYDQNEARFKVLKK